MKIYELFMKSWEKKRNYLVGDLMTGTARFFLSCPYVASTLEKEPEELVVNFREMDCMTLVETVTALVRTLQSGDASFDNYCHTLKNIRYRDGVINDYTDRLHYTTDWIFENERKGIVKDVTKEIGGKPLTMNLSFMSTHPDSYKQLKEHPEYVCKIAEKEQEINSREYYYIPENEINARASGIKNGDIVCFVTSIKGLDISHVGIISKTKDRLSFYHASSSQKKVVLNEEPLQDYVQSIKRNSGIMILRPQPFH
ncbi:N-acetylmuramoyl-L-alanine amidase-like domain-containing protein [Parabacteroides sp. APC149_11_2_Y6]